MKLLCKIGGLLGAAGSVTLSAALLAGCAAAPYPPEAGYPYPPPGVAGAPPEAGPPGSAPPSEYAQNTGPQGAGYDNPPAGGYGPPPSSEGYGPPPSGNYGPPPSAEGYGPPPSGNYGPPPPAAQGYGPPPNGGYYRGGGITREEFIARAQRRAIKHGRDPELAARRAARRFNRIDVDHNGIIEPAEMQAWRAAHPPHWRAQGAPPPAGYGYGPPPAGSPYQQ